MLRVFITTNKSIVIVVQKSNIKCNIRSWLKMGKKLQSCISHLWNNEWINGLSVGKREEQPNMDGNLLAKRFVCVTVRERATNSS